MFMLCTYIFFDNKFQLIICKLGVQTFKVFYTLFEHSISMSKICTCSCASLVILAMIILHVVYKIGLVWWRIKLSVRVREWFIDGKLVHFSQDIV